MTTFDPAPLTATALNGLPADGWHVDARTAAATPAPAVEPVARTFGDRARLVAAHAVLVGCRSSACSPSTGCS